MSSPKNPKHNPKATSDAEHALEGKLSQKSEGVNKWEKIAQKVQKSEINQPEPDNQEDDDSLAASEIEVGISGLEYPSRHQLEDQMTAVEMKCENYKNDLARIQAELANLHRRSQRDIENAHKYGLEKLILALLPIADSLVRGLEGITENEADPKLHAIRQGMSLTLDLFNNTLNKFGVIEIVPKKGDAFNPALHEAVSAQMDKAVAPNSVLQVLQRGYQLNGRVVRAAMVIVSQA